MCKKKILLVQYYSVYSDNKEYQRNRQEEVNYSFLKNIQNPQLDEIHVLTESHFDFEFVPEEYRKKIKQTIIGKRLTYEYAFKYYNEHLANTICILANADIYTDESLEILDHIVFTKTILAVSRYENDDDSKPPLLYGLEVNYNNQLIPPYTPTVWSQDAWIWSAPSIDIPDCDFQLGIPGCDCYILYLIITAGFTVYNPCHLVSIIHYDRMSISVSKDGKVKGSISKKTVNWIKSKEWYRFIRTVDDISDKYTICTNYTMKYAVISPTIEKSIRQLNCVVSASSFKHTHTDADALFMTPRFWSPADSDKQPYLECLFAEIHDLKIIDIRGKPVDKDNLDYGYISKFKVSYCTEDGWVEDATEYKGIPSMNGNLIKRTYVDITCKGIRMYPLAFVGSPALKVRFFASK